MEERDLLESAYVQAPTKPGNYIRLSEFCSKLAEIASKSKNDCKYCTDDDHIKERLEKLYENIKFNPEYQDRYSGETYMAFRINSNELRCIGKFREKIKETIERLPEQKNGWIECNGDVRNEINNASTEMGFDSGYKAVKCLLVWNRGGYEINGDEVSFNIRKRVEETKQGSALSQFACFIGGVPKAVNALAELALNERWYYDDKDKDKKPILWNYLCYTFERLQYEDSRDKSNKKILINKKNAVWNTGLVDKVYDPIFAFFERTDNDKNDNIKQDWVFKGFGTANSSYQTIITNFPNQPKAARYFDNPRELFYDVRANQPTYSKEHIFRENIRRLPIGFLKQGASDKFEFVEDIQHLSESEQNEYYDKLADAIYDNTSWLQMLATRFNIAMNRAISRVAWNYKTAIPVYYVADRKLQLLLPLALENDNTIDAALVCNHKYDEENDVNNYEGKTIFTLQMAYNNARLITRPDSDWLMADMFLSK